MEKLKPCPFCGSKDIYITTDCGYRNDTVVVFCNTCKTVVKLEENDEEGVNEKTEEKAVRAWNKRFGSILAQVNIDTEELAERIRQSVGEIILLDPKSLEPHIEPLDCKNVDWIPVTERLPELHMTYRYTEDAYRNIIEVPSGVHKSEIVLVTWYLDEPGERQYFVNEAILKDDVWCGIDVDESEIQFPVTAWQPLPKPYKGE